MGEHGSRQEALKAFLARLNVSVNDYALLEQALTHASAAGDADAALSNYESLEFLGDAVLGLAVSHWLFEHCPERTPGEYTKMRARVVNRRTLAKVAQRIGVDQVMRLGRGEETSGGRRRQALMADGLEAVLGAVYFDQGWQTAHAFVERVFEEELASVRRGELDQDYKSELQQVCQAVRLPLPEFTVTEESGPDHAKRFDVEVRIDGGVMGRGTGRTKKAAEQAAAREALTKQHQFAHEGAGGTRSGDARE